MSRATGKKIKRLLAECLRRQGGKCFYYRVLKNSNCRKAIDETTAILDHKDNNPSNNTATNICASCQSCNVKKNPRGAGKRGERIRDLLHRKNLLERERERERAREKNKPDEKENEEDHVIAKTVEMRRNMEFEPKYRDWLEKLMMEVRTISTEDAVNGGAEFTGCSQQTAKRYLDKLCSFTGQYEYYAAEEGKRYIRFKAGSLSDHAANWADR